MPPPHGLECGRENLSMVEPFQRFEDRLKTGGPAIRDGANGSGLECLGARTLAEIRGF